MNSKTISYMLLVVGMVIAAPGFSYEERKCDADKAGHYSYQKLAISRSQEWCIVNQREDDAQCKMEYIVHGLWPQCNTGYPSNCRLSEADLYDPIDEQKVYEFMPSSFLISHEWKKHGTCTGDKRSEYFATTGKLFKALKLPNLEAGEYEKTEIVRQLLQNNPGLTEDAIEMACDEESHKSGSNGRTLDEIRICYSVDGKFTPCLENENSCAARIKVRQIHSSAVPGSIDKANNNSSDDGSNITIMAANITSGNKQSYDPGHGVRIFQGLKPDIALIQEVNYESNRPSDYEQFKNNAFGFDYEICVPQPGNQIPNGIVSIFPIKECGYWNDPHISNRDFVYAKIDIPGQHDLLAVSVHFKTKPRRQAKRQATALNEYIKEHFDFDNDYLIIGGDFNSPKLNDSALNVLKQYVDISKPAKDKNGKSGTNASRSKPYDHVLPGKKLTQLEVPLEIGDNKYDSGIVFDSRVYSPLSDVSPVKSGDSGVSGMQHMAVMKEFKLY